MVLKHYQSFQDQEDIGRQVHQVFNQPEQWGNSHPQVPVIKLNEAEDTIVVKAIIPSLDEKSLEMQVTPESIVLSGNLYHRQRQTESPSNERKFSQKFRKVIALPQPILTPDIKTNYVNGILTLILPKAS
ncbi:MAG: Hsp20 family protein [Limnoraphis robusta]|jgi:HSP20 family protein|uniref:SHSP domain-containing protein n=2 Tax=Limnoraphis robusta TaxID=1118279 RepID=A0A0F5YN96_9CYAN|nr:Hsp20 family protein [Limnoraphis robusta]KKD39650.1 hypothetical protein WN50_02235 [Limnoraphis robusta CS-951]MEA5496336.1 Hsp20 family protein [Limnoraphis robusta BA-68 BA1]MEA5520074.1 Hsp20 family protein [Limnoraphis robusta CCNP1315]MEA5538282.1 Hsp20 family protein [Limnoraphis robusta Tam1]MEA5546770.1 Hsp20 family protein [Limnoraphis robusta CCNP1324]